MKDFTYKKTLDTQSIIVSKQTKKKNKQQLLFTLFFVLLLTSAVGYWTYKSYIKSINGYIVSRYHDITLIDDAFVVNIYVKQGDMIKAGDTLFSYVLANVLNEANNPNVITDLEAERRTLTLKVAGLQSELNMLQASQDSLLPVIDELKRNIQLGVATTDQLNPLLLTWQDLKNRETNARHLLTVNQQYQDETDLLIRETGNKRLPASYTLSYLSKNEKIYGRLLQYRIAVDDLYVIEMYALPSKLIYKKDPVMNVYTYANPRKSDIHISALIDPTFLIELSEGDQVQIYLGTSYLGSGTFSLRSSYVKKVDAFKLSGFSENNEAVFVRVDFDDINALPLKYHVNNLPVVLHYKRRGILYKLLNPPKQKET